jgi:protein CLEC16A
MHTLLLECLDHSELIVNVLQSLHALFENLSQPTCLYFVLSNNFLNSVLERSNVQRLLDNEEILGYYVTLIKTMSLKLTKDTLYCFFGEVSHQSSTLH